MKPFILALPFCLAAWPGSAVQENPQASPGGAAQDPPAPARSADLKPPPSLAVLARIGSPGLTYKEEKAAAEGIVFAPRGDVIAVAGDDEVVWLWDAVSLKEIGRVVLQGVQCRAIAFSPDGRRLALGDSDAGVNMHDARSLQEIWTVRRDPKPDLVDLEDPSYEPALLDFGPGMVTALAFSPDGSTIAAGGFGVNQAISIRDAATGRELRRLAEHAGPVYSLAYAPNGKILASSSEDATIRIRDPATGREIRRIRGHESNVYSLAFSPDGKSLASASGDKTVRIWDPATGREIRRFAGDGGFLNAVAFSPDGKTVASAGQDAKVRVWDLASGRELSRSVCPHVKWGNAVGSLAFSPDGRRLLADDDDGVIIFKATAQ